MGAESDGTLQDRVLHLERGLRRWRFLATLTVVGLALLMAMGTAAQPPKILQAEGLSIVDASGKPRVLLGAASNGQAGLSIMDAASVLRARLVVSAEGEPTVELYGAGRKSRVQIGLQQDGTASITLQGNKGGYARFGVDADETMDVYLDPRSGPTVKLGTQNGGGGLLVKKGSRTEFFGVAE